jgi:hypothetical protein
MNRHDLDWLSLFAGALFVGLGTTFLLNALGTWSADLAWVPPIVLIVCGLAGVVSTVARHNRILETAAATASAPISATVSTPSSAPAAPTAPESSAGFGEIPAENEDQLSKPGGETD